MEINTRIAESDRKEIAEGPAALLADTYTLYVKTHGYHWNVSGPMFRSLHLMFEEQYTELQEAADVIAERILPLGYPAPGSYGEFAGLATVKDEEDVPEAMEMVRRLVEAREATIRTARDLSTRPVGRRCGHRRPRHPADRHPREDGLDAARHRLVARAARRCPVEPVATARAGVWQNRSACLRTNPTSPVNAWC